MSEAIPSLTKADGWEIARSSRYSQSAWLCRDQLSDPVSVKQYFFQLKQVTGIADFDQVGVGIFSQNNEDGILLYIFARIGMTSKRSVEIGCDLSHSTIGLPEGNSINLIVNFGFDGLIVDIDADKTAAIRHFFCNALSTKHFHRPLSSKSGSEYFSPTIITEKIDRQNIDEVLRKTAFVDEIDLVSIDVDGEDVGIWQQLTAASPRVVVVEINNRLPFDLAKYGGPSTSAADPSTLEYQASYGSSLKAAYEVAAEKGYRFVGMNSTLINAFFVRDDIRHADLPARYPHEYLTHRMMPIRTAG